MAGAEAERTEAQQEQDGYIGWLLDGQLWDFPGKQANSLYTNLLQPSCKAFQDPIQYYIFLPQYPCIVVQYTLFLIGIGKKELHPC